MIPAIVRKVDYFLFFSMFLLLSLGLMGILSTNRQAFDRQLIFALSGLALYAASSIIDYRLLRRMSWGLFGGVLILLMLVFLAGVVSRGAVRWLEVSTAQFQPSEFAKVALVLVLAVLFEKNIGPRFSLKIFLLSLVLTGIPAVLVFLQPDLGTSLILLAIWLGILVSAGVNRLYLVTMILGGLLILVPLYGLLADYQKQRIVNFINPGGDPLGGGYHVLQSQIAIGSGQLWGRGFGRGTQSHLKFLPEYHTDFIFASLAEEWGFVGSAILLILVFILLWRILQSARYSSDDFGSLLAAGVFTFLTAQFFTNVGMNLGLLPVTGIPLPLISYGGSSLWVTMISLGLVQSVAIHSQKRLQ